VNPAAPSLVLAAIDQHRTTRPDATALAEIGPDGAVIESCTYSSLAAEITRSANQLAAAIKPEAAVISVMASGIDSAIFFLVALAAGARWLPMDARAAPGEIRLIAERFQAKHALVIGSADAEAALAPICQLLAWDRIRTPAVADPKRAQKPQTQSHLAHQAHQAHHAQLAHHPPGSLVLASSGTTALPKLVLRTSASLDADAAAVITGASLTPADCLLVTTPLSHSYGVDMLVAAMTAGAALHILPRFEPAAISQQIQSIVTVLPGVPFTFEALARLPPSSAPKLRLALCAGAPLPEHVRYDFAAMWGTDVGNLYGATELGTVAIHAPAPGCATGSAAGFVGKPLGPARFIILDPADSSRQLPAGQEGHLAVWAPSMLTCYLGEATPPTGSDFLSDGHFLTGDLARLDAHGALTITGRIKHLIDLGGCKINPLEIEAAILTHPGVAECVVIPVAASSTLSRLHALIVPRPGTASATPEALRQFLRPRLAAAKIPRAFRLIESLPKSPTGKLLRDQC